MEGVAENFIILCVSIQSSSFESSEINKFTLKLVWDGCSISSQLGCSTMLNFAGFLDILRLVRINLQTCLLTKRQQQKSNNMRCSVTYSRGWCCKSSALEVRKSTTGDGGLAQV